MHTEKKVENKDDKKKQVTMKDVAKKVGVTQATVSYALNGTANISEAIKEKIFRAVEELNYKPNYYAVALKTNRTRMIGVIIPDISNEYYARMVHIVERLLRRQKYTVIVNCTNYQADIEEACIKQQINYNVAGVIVMYQLKNQKCLSLLREAQKKVVVLEGGKPKEGFFFINTDNFYGGYTATKHLLEKGRKKIAYIEQTEQLSALQERRRGYEEAMKEAGLYRAELIYYTSDPADKWQEGIRMGKKLKVNDIDGVVVHSDVLAVGILKAILSRGRKVPDDIAVIGYDDVPFAEICNPSLTTIAQPVEEMCRVAVAYIFGKVSEQDNCWILKPHIKIRETT